MNKILTFRRKFNINLKMFHSTIEEIKPINGFSENKSKKALIYDMRKQEKKCIQVAAKYLKLGGVIALPTDTVYGLACIANDPIAVQELYRIKGRNNCKPVAICVSDIKNLKYWSIADHLSDDVLNSLLPGPVTIVLERSDKLENLYLNPGVSKIGIRIPNFNFIRQLCEEIKLPLALTSANRSNEKSSLDICEFKELWPSISVIIDDGPVGNTEEQRSASTVVDLSIPGKFKLIRDGVAPLKTTDILSKFNIIQNT